MNIFKKITVAAITATAVSLFAQDGNLLKYGDFENLPAGRHNMIKSMVKSGLDITRDPVCLTPGWYKKDAPTSVNVVEATDADKNAVKSGKNALNVKAKMIHLYTGTQFPMGTYDVSLSYKGKGRLDIGLYYYNAQGKHLGNSKPQVSLTAKPEWQTYNGKITVTEAKPGTAKGRFTLIFVSADINVDDIVIKAAK